MVGRSIHSAVKFILHQLLSVLGIGLACAVITFELCSLPIHLGADLPATEANWLLTEIPGFPIQTLVALFAGFSLAKIYRHKEMLFVWILPLISLILGMVLVIPEVSLSYFFSSACQPSNDYVVQRDHCVYQIVFGLPFLVSLAYALGALLARFSLRAGKQSTTGPSLGRGTTA